MFLLFQDNTASVLWFSCDQTVFLQSEASKISRNTCHKIVLSKQKQVKNNLQRPLGTKWPVSASSSSKSMVALAL